MNIEKYVSKVSSKIPTGWLKSENITTVLALLIAIYAGLAAPALPNSVIRFFDQWYGKLLFITIIALLASRNIQIALMVSVVFFIILHTASELDIKERFQGQCGSGSSEEKKEGFENENGENEEESFESKEGEKKETTNDVAKEVEKEVAKEIAKEEKKDGEKKDTKKATASPAVTDPEQLLQSTLAALQQASGASGEPPMKESFQTQSTLSVLPYDGSEEMGAPFEM
jgi:hypothetical protein